MTVVRCLYCDAENDATVTAGYCEDCGRKLPPASWARSRGARIYAGGDVAEEAAPTPGRLAANLLFGAAALQLVAGGLLVVLGPLLLREKVSTDFLPGVTAGAAALLLLFGGLGWWALYRPVPATVAALVLWGILAVAGVALFPAPALGVLPVQAVVVALLVQAVRVARRRP
jgi:hypothetical protein